MLKIFLYSIACLCTEVDGAYFLCVQSHSDNTQIILFLPPIPSRQSVCVCDTPIDVNRLNTVPFCSFCCCPLLELWYQRLTILFLFLSCLVVHVDDNVTHSFQCIAFTLT